jgi:hypothetical protein
VTGRLNIDLCGAVAPRKRLRGRQTIFSHVKPHQRAGIVVYGLLARGSALVRCYKQRAGHDRFHKHDAPLSGREGNLGRRRQVPLQSTKGFFSRSVGAFPIARSVGCEILISQNDRSKVTQLLDWKYLIALSRARGAGVARGVQSTTCRDQSLTQPSSVSALDYAGAIRSNSRMSIDILSLKDDVS